MTELAKKVGQYIVLVAITVVACGVMWFVSSRGDGTSAKDTGAEPPGLFAKPKALVAVTPIEPQVTELTIKQSGNIQAWENFSLGFEVAGRVQSLGKNEAGTPLDDGDRVQKGQVLARLDDRIYAARKSEAVAELERATSDLARDRRLFENRSGLISDAEYQETLTRMATAKAAHAVAVKNLEDTTLLSPVTGTISRRMIEPGESVMASTTVFEIVENDQLLLIVDVPESRIRELQERKRKVIQNRSDPGVTDPEKKVFRARVYLEGRDAFGNRWPPIDAEVYRIAQVAHERTKLFEVEVAIDNRDRLLRPGMVATTEIVVDRLMAYRLPDSSVVFRGRKAYLFTLDSQPEDVSAMFWTVGQASLHVAERIDLDRWVDEGEWIVVPADAAQISTVITRGQQRLTAGQHVRVVNPEELMQSATDATLRHATKPTP